MFLSGEKLRQNVRSWLSSPDPSINHKIACESRYTGTAAWFLQGDTFSEWMLSEPSSLLWIHGKRSLSPTLLVLQRLIILPYVAGAGKSILWYVDCDFSIFLP